MEYLILLFINLMFPTLGFPSYNGNLQLLWILHINITMLMFLNMLKEIPIIEHQGYGSCALGAHVWIS